MAFDPTQPDRPGAGGTVFTEPVLVVGCLAALIDGRGECVVYDQRGRRLATVVQEGIHGLRVVGANGRATLDISSPPESPMIVVDAARREAGRIVRENVFGRPRFALGSGNRRCGSINAADLRGWNFSVLDDNGAEIARITRTWEGIADVLRMTAHDRVLQIRYVLPDPLRTLVVAAAFAVHTAPALC